MIATLTCIGPVSGQGSEAPVLVELLTEFQAAQSFIDQFEVCEQIAALGDTRALPVLEPYLVHEDRHLRGNAAYVFGRLDDPRGVETLLGILKDFSPRKHGQSPLFGFGNSPPCPADEICEAESRAEIKSDRYYAVHLMGKLKDARVVEDLLELLADETMNYNAAWALGQIGDPRAVDPLIGSLADPDTHMRVSAVLALVELGAAEAIPYILELLDDQSIPHAGPQVPVAQTAREAIEALEALP